MTKSIARRIISAVALFVALTALPLSALAASSRAAAKHERTEIIAAQQELNKQGGALKADGVLGQKTRARRGAISVRTG